MSCECNTVWLLVKSRQSFLWKKINFWFWTHAIFGNFSDFSNTRKKVASLPFARTADARNWCSWHSQCESRLHSTSKNVLCPSLKMIVNVYLMTLWSKNNIFMRCGRGARAKHNLTIIRYIIILAHCGRAVRAKPIRECSLKNETHILLHSISNTYDCANKFT